MNPRSRPAGPTARQGTNGGQALPGALGLWVCEVFRGQPAGGQRGAAAKGQGPAQWAGARAAWAAALVPIPASGQGCDSILSLRGPVQLPQSSPELATSCPTAPSSPSVALEGFLGVKQGLTVFISSVTVSRHQLDSGDPNEKEGGGKRTGKAESELRDHTTGSALDVTK